MIGLLTIAVVPAGAAGAVGPGAGAVELLVGVGDGPVG
jgi:hypothetical protein